MNTPQDTRTDELADEITLEVLDWASGKFCPCGAAWSLEDAERVITRTPYLEENDHERTAP